MVKNVDVASSSSGYLHCGLLPFARVFDFRTCHDGLSTCHVPFFSRVRTCYCSHDSVIFRSSQRQNKTASNMASISQQSLSPWALLLCLTLAIQSVSIVAALDSGKQLLMWHGSYFSRAHHIMQPWQCVHSRILSHAPSFKTDINYITCGSAIKLKHIQSGGNIYLYSENARNQGGGSGQQSNCLWPFPKTII